MSRNAKAFLKSGDGCYHALAPKVTTIGKEGCDILLQVKIGIFHKIKLIAVPVSRMLVTAHVCSYICVFVFLGVHMHAHDKIMLTWYMLLGQEGIGNCQFVPLKFCFSVTQISRSRVRI